MLSDRPYMRDESPLGGIQPLLWLLGGLIGAFIVQNVLERLAPGFAGAWFGLSNRALGHGRLWTLLTYSLLHLPIVNGTGNLYHLLLNAFGIFLFGRPLLLTLGTARFFTAYTASVFAGAILWLASNVFLPGPPLIGASAGVYGLLALFCALFANEPVTLLPFPITIIPKYLGFITAGITIILFAFDEVVPVGTASGMAHSAHLGGMAAGLIFFRFLSQPERTPAPAPAVVELPKWLQKKKSPPPRGEKFKVNISDRAAIRAEVDRILDKINTSGFASLTAEEKRTLDEAREALSKR